jgi:hypothetical protein
LVVAADNSARVETLLKRYVDRIATDFLMTLPPAMKASG